MDYVEDNRNFRNNEEETNPSTVRLITELKHIHANYKHKISPRLAGFCFPRMFCKHTQLTTRHNFKHCLMK